VQGGNRGVPAHIWIVDAETGAARKLAAHVEPYDDEVPAWFPDGKRIVFQSTRTGRMELWVMNADGSEPRQLTK
jgi:TolB protein